MPKKIVIIGAGAAGLPIASQLRNADADIEITVFTKGDQVAYSPCSMPFVLARGIENFDAIIMRRPEFYIDKKINLRLKTTISKMDLDAKSIITDTGEHVPYDNLVIATGSNATFPRIRGTNLMNVFTLRSLNDGINLDHAIEGKRNAVTIGGGSIGLETSVAFLKRGLSSTVVEINKHVLPLILDSEMSAIVENNLNKHNVVLRTGNAVVSINGKEAVESVTLNDKNEDIPADLVLISTGVKPNTDLARDAGIDIGPSGGISTDLSLHVRKGRKSISNVFAAGDCIELINGITMQPFLSPLASSGVIQAGIVVQNLLGRNATMDFFITPNVCAIGTLRVGAVGLTIGDAILHGIQPTWGRATGLTKARYYPDAKEITVQLVGDSHQRLIGAQIISEEGVKERIDTLSVAIHRKMTARDLATTETCYAPPVSPLPDVLNTAAWNMVNKYPSIL